MNEYFMGTSDANLLLLGFGCVHFNFVGDHNSMVYVKKKKKKAKELIYNTNYWIVLSGQLVTVNSRLLPDRTAVNGTFL